MTPNLARHLAGPDAVLAARPRGVVHVVPAGPLTRSGRYIPRARRSVCRAHTGRLTVLTPGDRPVGPRVCARCSARLFSTPRSRRAEPRTRALLEQLFAGVTLDELVGDLAAARTEADVDRVLLVALNTHGIKGSRPLHPHITRHRARTHVATDQERARTEEHDLVRVAAIEQAKAERKATWDDRERRIADIGINNALPKPTRRSPR